ncbi:Holliday junction resolvase RuvX [Angustibacter sp. McL0619]|uniref:Holliday junction resolvase RuvX n=1 Tax=Angustibacter sp. McL0619 TaxID=3415676 RepID=UPI003CF3F243
MSEPTSRRGVRLGVDVGAVRVGLAVSDVHGMLATPVETLRRDVATDSDQDRIVREVVEREALEVVVGLPRSLSGAEGAAAATARAYAVGLAGRLRAAGLDTPVRLVDERLSTVEAHRSLRASGVAGRKQRSVVDQVAAVLVLQQALDTERTSGAAAGEAVEPVSSTGGGGTAADPTA